MDLYTTIRYLYTLILWITYTTQVNTIRSPRWLRNLLHPNLLSRNKRFEFGHKAESQEPEKYLKDCCKNNGLCILGSFCQCHKQFYGRYCQYELRLSQCGPVQHGQWFQSNCSLCRCYNGRSICMEGTFGKCDTKVFSKDYDPADTSNIVQIFPLRPGENHLENSWADADSPSTGSKGVMELPQLVVFSGLVLILTTGVV